jgi:hypothetical protein
MDSNKIPEKTCVPLTPIEKGGWYEARPQSKFPWGRLQKQNTISWKYLLQRIQQVFSYFST